MSYYKANENFVVLITNNLFHIMRDDSFHQHVCFVIRLPSRLMVDNISLSQILLY